MLRYFILFTLSLRRTILRSPAIAWGATLVLLCAGFALAAQSSAAQSSVQTAVTSECSLAIVTSPSTTNPYNELDAVSANSNNDVWAVGGYGPDTPGQLSLIEHWDGSAWSIIPSVDPSATFNPLTAVDAFSASDVWAVGYFDDPSANTRTLIEHWNGSSWSQVASVNSSTWQNELYGITVITDDDAWAVGYARFTSPTIRDASLIEHWDGTSWSIVPSPNVGMYDNDLLGVTAIASDDIWAAGNYETPDGVVHTLTDHWDGSAWTVVPSPDVPSVNNFVTSISAASTNDVWAVGRDCPGNCYTVAINRSFTMHWDGTAWSLVTVPVVGPVADELAGVKAISANDVWAVGDYMPSETEAYGLALHWDGSAWTAVSAETPVGGGAIFEGVDALSGNDLWGIGKQSSPGASVLQTLAERYTGCGSVTATPAEPSPTTTSAPPTSTPTGTSTSAGSPTTTAPAATPSIVQPSPTEQLATSTFTSIAEASPTTTVATGTPAPTACAITFIDVPPGSTFYTYALCLACKGVLAGYGDGTFRPNSDVTRGQLAKIVSNAAGFSEDPGPQLFQDVPPGSAFYTWINRLANRGYISGYPCGGPGERCGGGHLPYFRPYTSATRQQVSKVVSNSAGLSGTPQGQTFQDVPPNQAFYAWIERLADIGAMGGYQCGGTGEPCVPPANLPYFRPARDISRGQTAKIVANTFYPDCQTP